MSTKNLYFDESGQTGTNLLDPEQLFFSVGSTDIQTDEANAIIERCFPRHAGSDLKFKTLFRRHANRKSLIEFAKYVGKNPEHFSSFLMDKRFALLARMVDWFVEPVVSSNGYDWYKDDYGLRWVNMFFYSFSLLETDELLKEILTLYDTFCSTVSFDTLLRMQARYRQIADQGPEVIQPFMSLVSTGADSFEEHYALDTFNRLNDANDLHVTTIVSSVGWWRSRHTEDFVVVHDQSTHFFKRQGLWDRITSMEAGEGTVWVGAKSLSFPLRVLSTSAGDSQLLPSLQLCDLIAGFVAKVKSKKLTSGERELVDQMVAAGMGELNYNSVSPGIEFVKGTPAIANGPDAVDQVTILTRPQVP